MSDNLDNLLGDIYSSSSQSQGVKELANLINNLSSLLLKAISQLETRVSKLEQQVSRGGTPRPPQPSSPVPPPPPTTRAPMPKTASPFSAPSSPPPPPKPTPAATASGGPGNAVEAASMLGVTLKKAPAKTAPAAASDSGPSFLTGVVEPDAPAATSPSVTTQPDAVAPASMGSSGGGIAAPGGGFRGELAEKLANRRQKVAQQIEDDFDAPDLAVEPGEEEEEAVEDSTSSELKLDLEDELRSAFSKLKG
ncbi:MAG: hypothetical protein KAX09_00335 [Candidatus Heimdallarchaeota archaeon]|nr:hypothetical protein [Candidatus Heimdallarchaeota archaeon]MCK4289403.1 hypothetical protein [Candidatus Heimdallarchaeota archaeon]